MDRGDARDERRDRDLAICVVSFAARARVGRHLADKASHLVLIEAEAPKSSRFAGGDTLDGMLARAPSRPDVDCLSEDLIVRMVSGDASPTEEARARRHIDRCKDCRSLLADATRDDASTADLGSSSLLDSSGSSDSTEALVDRTVPPATKSGNGPSARTVAAGDTIGKYVVEAIVGRGGMGYVVSARHADLGHLVAIKIMHDEALDDREAVERFHREARALAQLRSEHTVRVIDSGIHGGRSHYIVMEHLEGANLQELLARHRVLPQRFIVECVMEACIALSEAHALGIVHRDLKPHNLFYTQRAGAKSIVRVLDFGLAKRDSREESITRSSVIIGTPYFMSPEQIRSSKTVDPRSDVWALGATLYRLLTGNYPFDGTMAATVVAAILKGQYIPLTTARPDISPALARVVDRCLTLSPSARFGTADELRRELARVHAELPLSLSFDPFGAADDDERTMSNEAHAAVDESTTAEREAVPKTLSEPDHVLRLEPTRVAGTMPTPTRRAPQPSTARLPAQARVSGSFAPEGAPYGGSYPPSPPSTTSPQHSPVFVSTRSALVVFVLSAIVFCGGIAVLFLRRGGSDGASGEFPNDEPSSVQDLPLATPPSPSSLPVRTAPSAASSSPSPVPSPSSSGKSVIPGKQGHSPFPGSSLGSPNSGAPSTPESVYDKR